MTTRPQFIFVGGVIRSGTSLVQKMLDLHPAVYGGPEMGMLTGLMAAYRHLSTNIATGKLSMVLGEETARQACSEFLHVVYAERTAGRAFRYISEKTPSNLLIFDALADAFPTARFVWVIRDPRDIVASMQAVAMRARARGLPGWPVDWLDQALTSIEKNHRAGERFMQSRGDRLHAVYYEDLIADPESGARALCEFLELEYDAGMLGTEAANDTSAAISSERATQGVYYTREMFDRPIDASNTGKWTSELTALSIRAIQARLGRSTMPSLERYRIGDPGAAWSAMFSVVRPVTGVASALSRRLRPQ